MKILILGSEGFVGKNLASGLSKYHQIFTADQLDNGSFDNYTKFDIIDYNSVEKTVKNVDVVIHLVAHSLVSSLDDAIINAKVNIIGLLNLLQACKKNNINKIVFTSASSLIGEPQKFSVTEDDLAKPKTAYGITKLSSEHYLRLYHELYGINYVIFRFFNIYGPHQKNGLVPSLYNKLVRNEPVTVFGEGNQIRDYVFVEDIVPFFEKACTSTIGQNSVFNMGTGIGTTILQIIDTMSEILKIKPKIDFQPPRPGEIGNFVADTNALKNAFGFCPQTSVKAGLVKTINWLKTQRVTA